MLIKKRHSVVEAFAIRYGDGYRELFIAAGRALRLLEVRIPAEATPVFLPADLNGEYKKEIHLYRASDNTYRPIEVAIRKINEPSGDVIYEYSTDYEL